MHNRLVHIMKWGSVSNRQFSHYQDFIVEELEVSKKVDIIYY